MNLPFDAGMRGSARQLGGSYLEQIGLTPNIYPREFAFRERVALGKTESRRLKPKVALMRLLRSALP